MKRLMIWILCFALAISSVPSVMATDLCDNTTVDVDEQIIVEDEIIEPTKLIGSEVVELSNGVYCDAYIYYNSLTGNMTYEAVMVCENKVFSSMQIVFSMSDSEGSHRDSNSEQSTTDCEYSWSEEYTSTATGNFYYWVNGAMCARIAFTATKSSVSFTKYDYM